MRAGQIAQEAGVHLETLRYYEKLGLLPAPPRRSSGYREYPKDTIPLLRFIKRAQELGFTLAEVEELLRLRSSQQSCDAVRSSALAKIEAIDSKVKSLLAMKEALTILSETCATEGEGRHCPLLEALSEEK
jgi:Hg(II)-responsive transcriptional regulator